MEGGKYFIWRQLRNILYQAKEIQDIYNKSYLDCQLFMSNFIPNPDGKMPKSKKPEAQPNCKDFF